MEKLSDQRIFEVISRDKEFFKIYLKNYLNRLIPNNYDDRLLNILCEYLNLKSISIESILKLAGIINQKSSTEVLRDYDLDIETVPKGINVYQKIVSILNIYHTLWIDLPIFEREALLNIHLMKARAFKSNNEFICLFILIKNLIENYYPPIIIDDKEKYYQILRSGDALKFAVEINDKTKKELNIIIELYKEYYLFPVSISIQEILIQKTSY
ncbi:MAG: hypothetical protein PHG03_05795 [Bacilli bacterium]|nr:hypothetical protein [Bacilli bacterium]MDD4796043.1 hypothetical protein [Bacilli bacterium]